MADGALAGGVDLVLSEFPDATVTTTPDATRSSTNELISLSFVGTSQSPPRDILSMRIRRRSRFSIIHRRPAAISLSPIRPALETLTSTRSAPCASPRYIPSERPPSPAHDVTV